MESETLVKSNNINQNSRKWTGIFLLIIGGVLFASKMGAPVPRWMFSWEVILIAIGLFIGVKHNFRNPAWFILILVGTASLADDYFPDFNIRAFIWPGAIMLLGVYFILKPKRIRTRSEEWKGGFQPVYEATTASSEEYVDITATFGGVKKRILSKNFKGGDITAFMGGAEIDLTQADIQNKAVIDVSAVFGGVKLIIPANWDIQNKATAVFGGVEDKRAISGAALDSHKLLIIDGTAVFGGIEIKSY